MVSLRWTMVLCHFSWRNFESTFHNVFQIYFETYAPVPATLRKYLLSNSYQRYLQVYILSLKKSTIFQVSGHVNVQVYIEFCLNCLPWTTSRNITKRHFRRISHMKKWQTTKSTTTRNNYRFVRNSIRHFISLRYDSLIICYKRRTYLLAIHK